MITYNPSNKSTHDHKSLKHEGEKLAFVESMIKGQNGVQREAQTQWSPSM